MTWYDAARQYKFGYPKPNGSGKEKGNKEIADGMMIMALEDTHKDDVSKENETTDHKCTNTEITQPTKIENLTQTGVIQRRLKPRYISK